MPTILSLQGHLCVRVNWLPLADEVASSCAANWYWE